MAIKRFGYAYLLMPLCAFCQPTATGTFQVLVKDAQGVPIPGAQVTYRRLFRAVANSQNQPVPATGEAVKSGAISVDSSGGTALTGLPSGSYAICGSVPGLPYVDPCKWSGGPIVTVVANATTGYTLTLIRGVFINIRINDPTHQLPQVKDGPLRAGKLIVGVRFGNGAYQGAQNTGVDADGRDYQIVVPASMPLQLWLFSRDIALKDAYGKTINSAGTTIPFQAAADQDQKFTFTVTGPLAQTF
jgi:hypothetical protein